MASQENIPEVKRGYTKIKSENCRHQRTIFSLIGHTTKKLCDDRKELTEDGTQSTITINSTNAITDFANNENITLVVDEKKFVLQQSLLAAQPDTMLGRMFSSAKGLARPNEEGQYEVASGITASVFEAIVSYYKNGTMTWLETVSAEDVQKACHYLLIPFNMKTVSSKHMGELIRTLSRKRLENTFTNILKEVILPIIEHAMSQCQQQCIIIVFTDDVNIHKADPNDQKVPFTLEYPVYNIDVFNFCSNSKNANVAKKVFLDNGFKNCQIGYISLSYCSQSSIQERVIRPAIYLNWD